MAVRLVGGAADRRASPSRSCRSSAFSTLHGLARRFRCRCRRRAGLRSSCVVFERVSGSDVCASHGCLRRRSASKARILSAWRRVRPMSSKPFSRQYLRNGCDVEARCSRAVGGLTTTCRSRSTVSSIAGEGVRLRRTAASTCASGSTIGSRPFLKQLLKKMSAKLGAIIARKPYCSQRPRRVLARRAAAEVLAREQDRRALVARLVQHEVRVRLALRRVLPGLAVVEVAPFVEQVRAEAGRA